MKYIIIFVLFAQLELFVQSGGNDYKFYPKLPAGEYKIHFKGFTVCHPDSDMQFNFFLSKTSSTEVEIKGNITNRILFDDTYTLNVMMSVKDSIGGWKDNAFVYQSPKACASLKNFFGSEWNVFLKTFGYECDTDCPIKSGVFVAKQGYDVRNMVQKTNLPKTFFYGTYKFRLFYTDDLKNIRGCMVFIVDLKRPWET